MKILTVNVLGIPSSSSSDLRQANILQDYDTVIVDPSSLKGLYGSVLDLYYNRDENIVQYKSGSAINSVNKQRREQVGGLLQRGGVIVCFLQPQIRFTYEWRHEGERRSAYFTNYDWLLESKDVGKGLGEINYGTGTTIDFIDSGHPFSEYLNTKPSWSAYIDRDACADWRVLASAFGTHVLALTKRIGLGHIILLPSYYDHHNGELLEQCIIKLIGEKDNSPQPSWAKAIIFPGQEELFSKIEKINRQASALETERQTLIDSNSKLERWKHLLYEKGKHQLEPVVREALALLDYCVEPQPDKDSDGSITCENGVALLEIVGSKGTIKIEKFGELIKNMGNFISQKEMIIKGILIGNPFCEEPLDNRPPKDSQKQLFAKELIESAAQQGITVLLTTDLYELVCQIVSGKLHNIEKRTLRDSIFKGRGLVRLI